MMLAVQALKVRRLDKVRTVAKLITEYRNRRTQMLLLSGDNSVHELLLKTFELSEQLGAELQQRQQQQSQQRSTSVIIFAKKNSRDILNTAPIPGPSFQQNQLFPGSISNMESIPGSISQSLPGPSFKKEEEESMKPKFLGNRTDSLPRIVSDVLIETPRIIVLPSKNKDNNSVSGNQSLPVNPPVVKTDDYSDITDDEREKEEEEEEMEIDDDHHDQTIPIDLSMCKNESKVFPAEGQSIPAVRIEEFHSDITDDDAQEEEGEMEVDESGKKHKDKSSTSTDESSEESSTEDSSTETSSNDSSSSEEEEDDEGESESSSSSEEVSTDATEKLSSNDSSNAEEEEDMEQGGGENRDQMRIMELERSQSSVDPVILDPQPSTSYATDEFIVNPVGTMDNLSSNQIGGGRRVGGEQNQHRSADDPIDDDDDDDEEEEEEEEEENILPPGNRFIILNERRKYLKRFKVEAREISMCVRQPPMTMNGLEWLEGAMRDLHTYLTESCQANDHIGVTINSDFFSRGQAWLSFRHVQNFHLEDLWGLISSIIQSNAEFKLNDSFVVSWTIVRTPVGQGRVKLTHEFIRKKSILTIRNDDNLCLPRSIVAGCAYAERGEIRSGELHDTWQCVRQENGRIQRECAVKLTREAGVIIPAGGCGVPEIRKFQKYLVSRGFAIVIHEFSEFTQGRPPLFDGTCYFQNANSPLRHTIHILHYERRCHYQPILNLTKAICGRVYCSACNISHGRAAKHRCSNLCPRCKSTPPCDDTVDQAYCVYCRRYFFGEVCFLQHMRLNQNMGVGSSTCSNIKACHRCHKTISLAEKRVHECGTGYCKVCKTRKPYNHLCYMTPIKPRMNDTKTIFIFYDFETCQNETLEGDDAIHIHVPNLCVAHQVCTFCLSQDSVEGLCPFCGVREFIFKEDPVKQLVELATRDLAFFNRVLCIAHNAKSFDAQFILRYLIEKKGAQPPELILSGTKIMSMRIGKTTFIDSLNYLQMPLSALPKAFGLPDSLVKGTFPHLFNVPENRNYVGELPSIEYYSPDTMKPVEREKFLKWYEDTKNSNYQFDFEKELVSYCRIDVDILRKACLALRKIFLETGNVCPFEEACTIASACSKVFRRNNLKPKSIGIVPIGGYRFTNRQSHKALEWLVWKEHVLGHPIIHAGREREFRLIENVMVDGYYETENSKNVLQFQGCFWHGCPRCFSTNRDKSYIKSAETMDQRFEKTLKISNHIRSSGYSFEEIWECDFDELKSTNIEMRNFLSNHPLLIHTPLQPRDAFYGGRTGNTVTLYEVSGRGKVHFTDVCSLYPYISKYGKFPVGHPTVYIGDECGELTGPSGICIDRVEGLVKCTVLPPRNLFHPVLPLKMHNHLLFPLCRTCCEEMNQDDCPHDDPIDRQFEGTWVSDELKKAVEKGYQIIKIHEIWQFEITQYDRETKTGGHFVEYINTFLKFKQEASNWPDNCITDEDKDRYLSEYREIEGITLDREKICSNSGMRSVAKLCLNSFWGKFGQRENLPKTEVVTSRGRLTELLTNPNVELCGILPVNHDILYVSWRNVDDASEPLALTNVVIAAYTTAQARLKLYSYLEKLDRRVLYYDTDSCIYSSTGTPGEYEPALGCFLGDMTDELSGYGEGSYIRAFASGGPKFYAYVVCKPDNTEVEVCKAKGITLNFETSSKVNFSTIRSFAVGEREEAISIEYDAIRRTPFHQVISKREKKICKPTAYKRRRDGEFNTLPFGFKKNS